MHHVGIECEANKRDIRRQPSQCEANKRDDIRWQPSQCEVNKRDDIRWQPLHHSIEPNLSPVLPEITHFLTIYLIIFFALKTIYKRFLLIILL